MYVASARPDSNHRNSGRNFTKKPGACAPGFSLQSVCKNYGLFFTQRTAMPNFLTAPFVATEPIKLFTFK